MNIRVRGLLTAFLLWGTTILSAQDCGVEVQDLTITQNSNDPKQLIISYDLISQSNNPVGIALYFSKEEINGTRNFDIVPIETFKDDNGNITEDIGPNILPGPGKEIIWDITKHSPDPDNEEININDGSIKLLIEGDGCTNSEDCDKDGISDFEEEFVYGTDPCERFDYETRVASTRWSLYIFNSHQIPFNIEAAKAHELFPDTPHFVGGCHDTNFLNAKVNPGSHNTSLRRLSFMPGYLHPPRTEEYTITLRIDGSSVPPTRFVQFYLSDTEKRADLPNEPTLHYIGNRDSGDGTITLIRTLEAGKAYYFEWYYLDRPEGALAKSFDRIEWSSPNTVHQTIQYESMSSAFPNWSPCHSNDGTTYSERLAIIDSLLP